MLRQSQRRDAPRRSALRTLAQAPGNRGSLTPPTLVASPGGEGGASTAEPVPSQLGIVSRCAAQHRPRSLRGAGHLERSEKRWRERHG